MLLNLWKNMITNRHRFSPDQPVYLQVRLLNLVLLALFVFSIVISSTNALFFQCYAGTVIDAVSAALSLAILIYFHKTDNIKAASALAVLVLFCLFAAFIYFSKNQHFALIWGAVLPPIAYFLLGDRKGRTVSVLFAALVLVLTLTGYERWAPAEFTVQAIINISVTMLVLILLISNFERSRKTAAEVLESKNAELEEQTARLSLLLDSTAEGIYGTDTQSLCMFCNQSCLTLLGYESQEQLHGRNMHQLIHHSRRDGTEISVEDCNIFRAIAEGRGAHVEDEVFWRADGTCFDVEYYSYPQLKDGKVIGVVVTFTDNTERRKTEKQIKDISTRDALTGLYNRRSLQEKLTVLDRAENLPISVIFGDVNGLKLTNDIFGHSAGDALIQNAADILKKVCRQEDIVARVGGDEFIIIAPPTEAADAHKIMSRIAVELTKSRIYAVKCSMSMGCDTKTDVSQDFSKTMENAESGMYQEKALQHESINAEILNAIIATLYVKSPREKDHSLSVGALCESIGEAMGLPERDVKKLKEAGFLHDIGMITMDDKLLGRQTEKKLTQEEHRLLQQHALAGYRILNLFDKTLDLAEGVFSHHESWDGSGFPKGLKGADIPLEARIIAVAERYDALITGRAHQRMSRQDALLAEIKRLAGQSPGPAYCGCFIYGNGQTEK